jgi:hypothetical protein
MTKELKMNAIPMTEDAASTVQATNNLEYVNIMEYLPLRYPPTLEEEKNRRIVSNFKRGRCSPELKNQFTDAIKQLKEERKDVKLRVCFIPAITADKTALRYSQLATAIESETGIPSDYHTILPKRATELMATGKTDPAVCRWMAFGITIVTIIVGCTIVIGLFEWRDRSRMESRNAETHLWRKNVYDLNMRVAKLSLLGETWKKC